MTDEDCMLLDTLSHIGDTLARFSGGILTNSLSVTEQLDLSHKLIAAAGRIRTRVENAAGERKCRTADGDAP